MEFFGELPKDKLDVFRLQDTLKISTLAEMCDSIDTVISDSGNKGEIYCLWGQFAVSRDAIKKGVRFALLNCPHALAWTIAYHADHGKLVVHCTIDDREEEAEFIESIKWFVADWIKGLQRL